MYFTNKRNKLNRSGSVGELRPSLTVMTGSPIYHVPAISSSNDCYKTVQRLGTRSHAQRTTGTETSDNIETTMENPRV